MDFYQQANKVISEPSDYDIINIEFQGGGNPFFEYYNNERESEIDISSLAKEYLEDYQHYHDDFVYYKVEQDDSIFGLELKFEVSAVQILRMNNISENSIYPGIILKIPLKQQLSTSVGLTPPNIIQEQQTQTLKQYQVQYITQVGAFQGKFTILNNYLLFEPDRNNSLNEQLTQNAKIRDIENLQLQILLKHVIKVESQQLAPNTSFSIEFISQQVLVISIQTKKLKIVVLKLFDDNQMSELLDSINSAKSNITNSIEPQLMTIIPYHFENDITKPLLPTDKQINCVEPHQTKLNTKSEIISLDQFVNISSHLPFLFKEQSWSCIYSSILHGSSILTLLRRTETQYPLILLIKDLDSYVFGAYVSEGVKNSYGKFYGSGESFLFTFKDCKKLEIFRWTHINSYFTLCDKDGLAVGCGDKYGLFVNSEISSGYTCQCDTFNNDILSKKPNFTIERLEIWGISYN